MNGSTSSRRPSGLNILQWCFSTTFLSEGSTLHKCSQASCSKVSVVDDGNTGPDLDGDASVAFVVGKATWTDPLGVDSGALVMCGSAGREAACPGDESWVSLWAIRPTAEGVGVNGGGSTFGSATFRLLFLGVTGTSGMANPSSSVPFANMLGAVVGFRASFEAVALVFSGAFDGSPEALRLLVPFA